MITDPWFYAVAIPAVILVGISKGGFAGISALSLPLLALQISPLRGAVIMLPILIDSPQRPISTTAPTGSAP